MSVSTKVEFAVQMTCDSCVNAVKKSLDNVEGVNNVDINLKTGTVVIDTSLSTEHIQKLLEKSGRKSVVKGYDGQQAGVAILDTGVPSIKGVVRFIQINNNTCIVDGTIDGLKPGQHELSVHECGDLSKGCQSVGKIFHPNDLNTGDRIYGKLGNVNVQSTGRANFRFEDNVVKLSDIIGRSLVVSDSNKRLICGIIARSSGLFENPKTICACDGISIWDERNMPKPSL